MFSVIRFRLALGGLGYYVIPMSITPVGPNKHSDCKSWTFFKIVTVLGYIAFLSYQKVFSVL